MTVCSRARSPIGGGCRSEELTLPGFVHDTCSTVHPLALASPFLSSLPLASTASSWCIPRRRCAPARRRLRRVLERSVEETARASAGRRGLPAAVRAAGSRRRRAHAELLGPLRPPRHPLVWPLRAQRGPLRDGAARSRLQGERARALFAGCCAHSMLSLRAARQRGVRDRARAECARGRLARGPAAARSAWPTRSRHTCARSAARSKTGRRVESLDELPAGGAALLDVTPRQLLEIAGERLPDRYRAGSRATATGRASSSSTGRSTARSPGARRRRAGRDGPPGRDARRDRRLRGGGLEGRAPGAPFVLLVQPSLFDPTRAPAGKHTAWAYCHVPERLDARHDRGDRGAGRALRARVSGT